MSDLRAAAQKALKSLLARAERGDGAPETVAALRAALEQPEQEPVAWSPALTYPGYEQQRAWVNGKPQPEDVEYWAKNGNGVTYVYTHPPRREWQGLTDTEIGMEYVKWDATPGVSMGNFARAIEAALKEKNK